MDFLGVLAIDSVRLTSSSAGRASLEGALGRSLVLAQTQEDGLAHLLIARPLGEFHFTNECRLDPLHRLICSRLDCKRAFTGLERLHLVVELLEQLAIKATSNMPNRHQFAVAVQADDERAKIFARVPGLG